MIRVAVAAVLIAVFAQPAAARPVTDCPLRDRPFSIDTPLIDLLVSERASAVVERESPGAFARVPEALSLRSVPGFGAIFSLRAGAPILGISRPALDRIGATLRTVPVTALDRTRRCARYDAAAPRFALPAGKPRILLFEKVVGARDAAAIDAAHSAFVDMARRNGWAIVATDRAGALLPATLRQFDLVIWNNVSGDVLTLSERRSFERWMTRGGAFVGVHGSGGDPIYFWDWYADTLLGARFAGHPRDPAFRETTVRLDPAPGPIASGLPQSWTMREEWYSFKASPRSAGAHVVASLDEGYLTPGERPGLSMGDHPIAWTRCIGRGRMFYTAIGHRPESYTQPQVARMLESAVGWALSPGNCASR